MTTKKYIEERKYNWGESGADRNGTSTCKYNYDKNINWIKK